MILECDGFSRATAVLGAACPSSRRLFMKKLLFSLLFFAPLMLLYSTFQLLFGTVVVRYQCQQLLCPAVMEFLI